MHNDIGHGKPIGRLRSGSFFYKIDLKEATFSRRDYQNLINQVSNNDSIFVLFSHIRPLQKPTIILFSEPESLEEILFTHKYLPKNSTLTITKLTQDYHVFQSKDNYVLIRNDDWGCRDLVKLYRISESEVDLAKKFNIRYSLDCQNIEKFFHNSSRIQTINKDPKHLSFRINESIHVNIDRNMNKNLTTSKEKFIVFHIDGKNTFLGKNKLKNCVKELGGIVKILRTQINSFKVLNVIEGDGLYLLVERKQLNKFIPELEKIKERYPTFHFIISGIASSIHTFNNPFYEFSCACPSNISQNEKLKKLRTERMAEFREKSRIFPKS